MNNDYERYNFWHLELDQFKAELKKKKDLYNKEIDEAVEKVRNGESISNDDVMKQMKNW
jgi:hypothetical protein